MSLRIPAKRLMLFVLFLGVAFARLAHDDAAAEKIKFALPGNSMGYLPLFVAVHQGFFKDEGIDIELPRLIPAMAQNALLAGEVQYHGLADSGLRLAARGVNGVTSLPLTLISSRNRRRLTFAVAGGRLLRLDFPGRGYFPRSLSRGRYRE